MPGHAWSRGLLSCLTVILLQGCGAVFGHIPPEAFQFHEVVPYTPPGEGGWKVAQVNILLGRISRKWPQGAWCDVEVGVPAVNWRGLVHDEDAQEACAEASDKASRFALRRRMATVAALCEAYRTKMREFLKKSLPGAEVTRFQTQGITPEKFP